MYNSKLAATVLLKPPVETFDVYMDAANGNDTTGNGSISRPYKTLSKLATVLQAGQKVGFKPGNYYTDNGITLPVAATLKSINGNLAAIRGSRYYTSGITKKAGTNYVYQVQPIGAFGYYEVYANGIQLTAVADLATCDATENSFVMVIPDVRLYVHVAGGAAVTSIEQGTHQALTVASNTTITNMPFSKATFGATAQLSNVTLNNITFDLDVTLNGTIIANNCNSTARILPKNGAILNNCTAKTFMFSGTGGTCNYCTARGSDEDGFSIISATGQVICNHCVSIDHWHVGFFCNTGTAAVPDMQCYYCVSYQATSGDRLAYGFVSEGTGATMTCYHCVAAWSSRSTHPAGGRVGYMPTTFGTMTAKNCISYNNFSAGAPTVTDYCSGLGGTHAIVGDPLFVDAVNGDFHLQDGSPCRNAGVPIPGINDGYLGSAPDVGAYERG